MNKSNNKVDGTINNFFKPSSIAILGASNREQSIGWRIICNLKSAGYKGNIYPINPKYEQILEVKTYKTLLDVKETVDLAIIALSVTNVINALEECEKANIKFVIIISAGFAEAGAEGRKIQEYISEFAKRTRIRILGPNCQGAINFIDQIVMSFSSAVDYGNIKGTIAIVSQSGSTGHALYNIALERGLGLSYLVTTGNEADLSTIDFHDYLLEEPSVKVIAGYSEGFKRPKELLELGKKSLLNNKPIIILKPGKSEAAQKAISSHTAALAGSNKLFTALLKQAGIIQVNDIDELLDAAYTFSSLKVRPAGNRVGICSTSGGAGVMLTDACIDFGLKVPELQPETIKKLEQLLPSFGTAQNPVDVTAQVINDQESLTTILITVAQDPGIDVLLIGIGMCVGKAAETRAKVLRAVAERVEKPVLVVWVTGKNSANLGIKLLEETGIPTFQNPSSCARALNHVIEFEESLNKSKKKTKNLQESTYDTDTFSFPEGEQILPEYEAKQVLSKAGFDTVREQVVQTAKEAISTANEFGYPVVLKIHSPQIPHKTESGGVKLNLLTDTEVAAAFEQIVTNAKSYNSQAEIKGVLVQEMVDSGVEVILGSTCDPLLGPIIMFGLGGIYVELAKDVSFRVPPITKTEAREMIADTKIAHAILSGARGRARCDIDALSEVISRFSYLVSELKDNVEIDINPIIVMPEGKGTKIVDALIVKKPIMGD